MFFLNLDQQEQSSPMNTELLHLDYDISHVPKSPSQARAI